MSANNYFKRINFNKRWAEADWEKYFQAYDAYRVSEKGNEIRRKPAPKFKFLGVDEVDAFEPVLTEFGSGSAPSVLNELHLRPFPDTLDPDTGYVPTALDDPHHWIEGAPLASLPIYRDCCRFAIAISKESGQFIRSRKKAALKKTLSVYCENLKFHAYWIAVNIAQGHHIGYLEDLICGNIVKCRRAIRHADACIAILNHLSRYSKSQRLRRHLFSYAVQLRHILFMWLRELRDVQYSQSL